MKSFYALASFLAAAAAASIPNTTESNCPSRPATRAEQEVIFEQAVQAMIVDGDYIAGANKFYSEDYINHDPSVLSGRENVINFLSSFPEGFNITIANKAIQNGHAYILQKVDIPGSPSLAWTDVWRFEGTCIMEHWSVYMSKPENSTNPLPLV